MNSINTTYQRLEKFVSEQRRKGKLPYRVILFEVPRRFFQKSYFVFVAFVNDVLMSRLFNIPRFRAFQRVHADRLGNHFYIIVMPNTLHFLLPCLRLLPKTVNVFLILNGVGSWEEDYLREYHGNYPAFKLTTFPKSSLSHGSVLNLLIDHNDYNFGIMDHDLYVFNPAIFTQFTFREKESVIGVFKLRNRKAGLEFPTTHFLFFNIGLVKGICKKYQVGAQAYSRIPVRLKSRLASLNLGYHNFLKEYLFYFDTLNLIFAMMFYEKLAIKFLEISPGDLYHLGGTSSDQGTPLEKYIGLRFLELNQHNMPERRYAALYDRIAGSHDLKWYSQTPQTAPAIAGIEKIIAKIEDRMRRNDAQVSRGLAIQVGCQGDV